MADLLQSGAASNIVPPDPQAGLRSLSSILGIQQQRQALVTGQATQATAQAEAQQAGQKNQELQTAQSAVINGARSGKYTNPDGSLNRQKIADDITQIGPYAQATASSLLSQANEVVQNQKAHQDLTVARKQEIGNAFAALAADPQVDNSKVIDTVEGLRQAHPGDAEYSRLLTSMTAHMPNTANSQQLQKLMGQWSSAATGTNQLESGTNAAGQNQVVNKFTQERSAPQLSGGATNPTSSEVAGKTIRQGGGANADIDTSNNVVAAQRDARTNIDLTKRIDQLADIVNPGTAPGKISALLGATGLTDVNQARTELQKDLGRLRGSASARAGSDSRAAEILSGLPTDTTPTQTIHQAMDVTRGSARQDLALGKLREKTSAETKGNMNGFQGDYAHAVGAASPLMHEYLALSPQDQVGFFQRNFKTKDQAKAFRAQAESVKKLSPDVVGQ